MQALLEGKPFGHPLHPILVHYPIGLFVLSLLFDVAGLFGDENWLVRAAFYALLGGALTALLAAIPGLVDWWDIRRDHRAKRTATTHMLLNLAAVGLYALSLILRWPDRDASETPVVPVLLSLVGIGLISVSGYLGGTLVYADGIAVGRHRRATPPPRETISAAGLSAGRGLVPIPDAESLGEGETLRVEVDGLVLAVARVDGELAAFQEFCTHRYGPLSEGRLCDGEVECPWHRSRFDVRTGKVTQGPAKVDLRIFPVVTQDGRAYLQLNPSANDDPRAPTMAAT